MKNVIMIILMFITLNIYSNDGIFDGVTSIKNIIENPDKYSDKEIKIKGMVVKSASLLMQSGYIIKDESGEIFVVVSGKMPPKLNDTIIIKGKSVVIGSVNDKNFVIFKENKPKEEK
jgi:hypothetical protein